MWFWRLRGRWIEDGGGGVVELKGSVANDTDGDSSADGAAG